LQGNDKVIGLNYLNNKKQREVTLNVRDSQSLDGMGPVKVPQGGQAFIGRAPIFYFDQASNKELSWGLIFSFGASVTELEKTQPIALRRKQALRLRVS
jgi:sensor domain CHASE-containing protein